MEAPGFALHFTDAVKKQIGSQQMPLAQEKNDNGYYEYDTGVSLTVEDDFEERPAKVGDIVFLSTTKIALIDSEEAVGKAPGDVTILGSFTKVDPKSLSQNNVNRLLGNKPVKLWGEG